MCIVNVIDLLIQNKQTTHICSVRMLQRAFALVMKKQTNIGWTNMLCGKVSRKWKKTFTRITKLQSTR